MSSLAEWLGAPLIMFLILFWMRDNLNILHMPLADLVGIVAVADVAMAMHHDELQRAFDALGNGWIAPDPAINWAFSVLGILTCVLLVYGIERKIRKVTIHYISVGFWHKPCQTYLSATQAIRAEGWQRFAVRWALGFAVTVAFVSLHFAYANASPMRFLGLREDLVPESLYMQVMFLAVLMFIATLVFAVLLTYLRYFRYSDSPLDWTYKEED